MGLYKNVIKYCLLTKTEEIDKNALFDLIRLKRTKGKNDTNKILVNK